MGMKNFFLFSALFFTALLFNACLDTTEVTETVDPESLEISRVDTLYVASQGKDTVILVKKDTIITKADTVTLVNLDTLTVNHYDTLIQKDTVHLASDTLRIYDTTVIQQVVIQKDTLVQLDTLVKLDTLVYKDTIYSRDTTVIRDTLFVEPKIYTYFLDVKEIIANLKDNEKVSFILRHAERGDDYSETGGLNDNGKNQSRQLGEAIKNRFGTLNDVYFSHSKITRAVETAQYIANGMGVEFKHATNDALGDKWYVSDENKYNQVKGGTSSWIIVSRWAYTNHYAEAFHDLNSRSLELQNTALIDDYEKMHRFSFAISHDLTMVPFTAWATDLQLNLRYYETESKKQWINYLAGVAIIVNDKNEVRRIPVCGLNRGFQVN